MPRNTSVINHFLLKMPSICFAGPDIPPPLSSAPRTNQRDHGISNRTNLLRHSSFDSHSYAIGQRSSTLAPINETGTTADFSLPANNGSLLNGQQQDTSVAGPSSWRPRPNLKKSETIGLSRNQARPQLMKRGSLPMIRDRLVLHINFRSAGIQLFDSFKMTYIYVN